MKINNYIILRTLHPLKTRVMYLDVCMQNQYLGDKFLIEEGVKVDYSKEEFRNDRSAVVMVAGKIARSDIPRFAQAMASFKQHLDDIGFDQYAKECELVFIK